MGGHIILEKGSNAVNESNVPSTLRLIGELGEQLGIISGKEALAVAKERGFDLVKVAPKANPPVYKLMDYGKFKYVQRKKLQEARKKQSLIEIKEIKLSPRTNIHDVEVKVKHILRFLEDGNKAKINVVFKGREVTRPNLGAEILDHVKQKLYDDAVVENGPKMEGRIMSMILAPKTKKRS